MCLQTYHLKSLTHCVDGVDDARDVRVNDDLLNVPRTVVLTSKHLNRLD